MKTVNATAAPGRVVSSTGKKSHPRKLYAALITITAVAVGLVIAGDYPAGAQNNPGAVVIDDFQGYSSSPFSKWMIRDATRKAADSVYRLLAENDNIYLGADSSGSSIQIAKKVSWNINRHPLLTWKWRARRLPANANEAYGNTNDSAASIYVIFQRARVPFMPWDRQPINVIKYVWSTTLPVGSVVNKKKEKLGVVIYEGRFLVLQTGRTRLGSWMTERRNVFDDYRRLFGTSPPGNPVLVAILTDSNETRSSAAADYDDIMILTR